MLAGNSNIVRLSSKDFPQVDIVCEIIKDVLKNYPEIEKRTAFIKYDRSDEISEYFSKIADGIIIGNAIVKIIEKNGKEAQEKVFEYIKEMDAVLNWIFWIFGEKKHKKTSTTSNYREIYNNQQ